MGNIRSKMRKNLDARRAAFEQAGLDTRSGYHRPGSMKKKHKAQPGDTKGSGRRR